MHINNNIPLALDPPTETQEYKTAYPLSGPESATSLDVGDDQVKNVRGVHAVKIAATSNIELPPDQSFRKIQRDRTTILLSVAEEGVRLGQGSDQGSDVQNSPKGYHVFAESIQLNKSFTISLDSGAATVSTHTLQIFSGQSPDIAVSGAAGKNNDTGATREDSINGRPAGALSVYVEQCGSDIAHFLTLSANGGTGGDTKEGKGTAGNGGLGGSVQWVGFSAFTDSLTLLDQFANNKSFMKQLPDSDILTPSHPITTYLRNVLANAAFIPPLISPGFDIQSTTEIYKPIKGILDRIKQSIRPVATIADARNAIQVVQQTISNQCRADNRSIVQNISVSGGSGGSVEPVLDGRERGSAGEVGKKGMRTVTFLSATVANNLRQQTMVFIHPDQCQMLYDRSMTYWYFGRNTHAIQLLSRLVFRLAFLPLKDDDPLAKAYAAQEVIFRTKGSISKLTSIREQAMHQLCVLQSGRIDFYGNMVDWVPRVSFTEYRNFLTDAMDVFKTLESSYVKYHAALDNQQSVNDAVQVAKPKIDDAIADIGKERAGLLQKLTDLDGKIELAGPVVEEKHKIFQKEYEKFKVEVDNAHRFTPGQISNGLSSILGVTDLASAANTALTGLGLVNDWDNKIPDDNDNLINKKYLINKIRRSIATGLEDFDADFTTDQLTGDFVLDQRLPQYLMEEKQLDDILADYSTAAFAQTGEDLKRMYKDFTDALASRNKDMVAYNAIIQTITSQGQQVTKLQDMRKMSDKDVIIDEDLERMTGYIRLIFENARARVMRYLSLGQQALRFKVLRKEDLLDNSSGKVTADVPLSVTSDVLAVIKSNLDDLLLRATEDNSGAPAKFPDDWNTGKGKRRVLSRDELRSLLADKTITISQPPVFPGQPPNSLSTDFTNCVNVRIFRVRLLLVGLKAKRNLSGAPQMKSIIKHTGNETIVSRIGVPFYFEHSALNTLHNYSLDTQGRIVSIGDDGTLVSFSTGDSDSLFGAPGPFTTWEINSKDADWADLDVSGVTGGYLEFFGTNYAPLALAH